MFKRFFVSPDKEFMFPRWFCFLNEEIKYFFFLKKKRKIISSFGDCSRPSNNILLRLSLVRNTVRCRQLRCSSYRKAWCVSRPKMIFYPLQLDTTWTHQNLKSKISFFKLMSFVECWIDERGNAVESSKLMFKDLIETKRVTFFSSKLKIFGILFQKMNETICRMASWRAAAAERASWAGWLKGHGC